MNESIEINKYIKVDVFYDGRHPYEFLINGVKLSTEQIEKLESTIKEYHRCQDLHYYLIGRS